MRLKKIAWLALVLSSVAVPCAAGDDAWLKELVDKEKAPTLAVELGCDVAGGRYGSRVNTTTVAFPVSLLYFPTDRLDLGLTAQYLRQNNAFVVEGRVVRNPQLSPPAAMAARTAAAAQPQSGPVAAAAAQTAASQARSRGVQGIGDLYFTAGYLLVREGDLRPQLRPVLTVKFPTAESSLGTGAFDGSVGLTASKGFGSWYLFANGDYTLQGRTSLFTAKNFVDGETGVGYEVLPGLRPSLGVKGATPAEAGVSGTRQGELKMVYAATQRIDVKLNLDRGLSTASPDWEGGLSLTFNF